MSSSHIERHFKGGLILRDIVIGMSDGLTVPFALAAGLSGAVDSTTIIVTAGLAEIAAGAIAMGLGGYLAGKSDVAHYNGEKAREHREVREVPETEAQEIHDIFKSYGLTEAETTPVVDALRKRPDAWVDFMMRFELGLEAPDPKRAVTSAATIGLSYVIGGLIPLLPYMMMSDAGRAFRFSALSTGVALVLFGAVKGKFGGVSSLRSAVQTLLIGGLAATAAFVIAKWLS